MEIKNAPFQSVLSMPGINGSKITADENLEFVKLEIESGKEIPLHPMPIKVFFFVLSGTPTFLYEDEEHKMTKNTMLECEPTVKRGWRNDGDETAEILVVKSLS